MRTSEVNHIRPKPPMPYRVILMNVSQKVYFRNSLFLFSPVHKLDKLSALCVFSLELEAASNSSSGLSRARPVCIQNTRSGALLSAGTRACGLVKPDLSSPLMTSSVTVTSNS